MRGEIIEGNFPKGAELLPIGLFRDNVVINWAEGWMPKYESLKNKIEKIELLDKTSLPSDYPENGLTPLEGGIIGGSVAGYEGFLAGYLSLPDRQEKVIFICHLADGRYFIAVSDIEMYNLISNL